MNYKAAQQHQESVEAAQQEQEAARQSDQKPYGSPAKFAEQTSPVEIRDSAPVKMARQFLQNLQACATSDEMEKRRYTRRWYLMSLPLPDASPPVLSWQRRR